jgi:hypothetical protein
MHSCTRRSSALHTRRLLARAVLAASVCVAGGTARLAAQLPGGRVAAADSGGSVWLPGVRFFTSPLADPIEPRFAIGLIVTDILSRQGPERLPFTLPAGDDGSSDTQAAAAIGATIPFLRLLDRPEGGIVVAGYAGVFARFRIELPSRDDLGQDWVVGMPIEVTWNAWSGRVRIAHRSSHLGDEFSATTGARRIEFGGEAIDGLLAYRFPGIARVYGGGGWIFHSNTSATRVLRDAGRSDRFTVQAGADGEWFPAAGPVGIAAGVDWQAAERSEWAGGLAVAAGVSARANGRVARVMLRYYDGNSYLGEFFLTPERFWSIEVVVD